MAFTDLREWLGRLDKRHGRAGRITAEVDWDRELGAIAPCASRRKARRALREHQRATRPGDAPARHGRSGDRRRLALALGFPKDVPNRSSSSS